ncbi:MAG: S8 family serine peptidase [Ruminococcus sp.]|nr:S8 family serine peptidase [Ruminococcus sp.]
MKKRIISVIVCILLLVGMLPLTAFAADAAAENIELIEGTYAPGQVVVLFKNSAIDTDSVPKKGELASVGANLGEMMDASSSAREAYAAADEETDILSKSLGADFVLEDTLVFDDAPEREELLPSVGASADPVSQDELTVALVSSDKYDTATMIRLLGRNKNVVKAEPNYYVYPTSFDDYALNDPYNSYLYNVNSPAARNTGGEQVDDRGTAAQEALSINASSAWKKLTGDEDEVVVAVVDTGVLAEHEDLRDMMWTNPGNIGLKGVHGYDFYNNDGDPTDDNDHGTHCAGTIAAQANNLKGVAGVASKANVKIMALKMLGSDGSSGNSKGTVYQGFGCFHYIHKAVMGGVNVVAVNNSWGGAGSSDIYDEVISVLCEDGVICYVAASNDAADNDRTAVHPANSGCDNVITVGAADITGQPAGFSDYGKTSVDVFGPGMNILSTVSGDNWYPMLYDEERFNATAAYYGEFNADTAVTEGTITPSVGSKAGEDVKPFGSLQFVKQRFLADDDDYEVPDDAVLELSVEQGRHLHAENPYRLKITVKNAQYGEMYFISFPYEKDPQTDVDNIWVAIDTESIASSDGSLATFYAGDFYRDEDGNWTSGGVVGVGTTDFERDRMARHFSQKGSGILHSVEEDAEDKESSFGLLLVNDYEEGEAHDVSIYLDSIAISKPELALEPNTSYTLMSGTSQATPAVCGAGTLLAALNPRQEGESGADYVGRIRAKLFACVRRTDALADLCSTGGYVDLSLIDSAIPSVSNALCDTENESIILTGENLFAGSTVTYRRLAVDGAEEEALPDDMPVEYAVDGSKLIIHHAKRLFSTYTAFTVTAPSGAAGTGKFFLVKGQSELPVVNSFRQSNDMGEVSVPFLVTDAEGRGLYGYYPRTYEICRYDGEQFITYRDTNLREAMRKYLMDNGEDVYSVYNDHTFTYYPSNTPIFENGVIYMPIILYIPEEAEEGEKQEQEEEQEQKEKQPDTRKDCYLASFDLNSDDHHWQITGMTIPPDAFWLDDATSLTPTFLNGKLVYIGDSILLGEEDSALPVYSYDLRTKEWTKEPELPYVADGFDCVPHDGRLYVMFGCDPDTSLPNEERILSEVWCFDGEKWEKKHDDLRYVGRVIDAQGVLFHPDAITAVKNGIVFVGASVDGGGNMFLYHTDTDQIEPLYYTPFDSITDTSGEQSCVATRDGIYYLYSTGDESNNGWDLCLLPVDSGAYESPFEDYLPGDANLDGRVDIRDVTAIQRHIANFDILSGKALLAADANGDGKVTIEDATLLQMFFAEFDVVLGQQSA